LRFWESNVYGFIRFEAVDFRVHLVGVNFCLKQWKNYYNWTVFAKVVLQWKKGPIFDPQCIFWIYLRVREVKNTWVNPLEIFSGRGENFENWQPVLLTLSDWGVPSVGYFLNSQHFHQEPPLQLYKFRQTLRHKYTVIAFSMTNQTKTAVSIYF